MGHLTMVTRVREHHSTFSNGIGNTQELSILPGHFLVLRKGKVLLSYLSVILCGDGLKPTHSPFFPRKPSNCFSLTEGRFIAMANYICHSGRRHNKGSFRVQYVRESNQLALWPRVIRSRSACTPMASSSWALKCLGLMHQLNDGLDEVLSQRRKDDG